MLTYRYVVKDICQKKIIPNLYSQPERFTVNELLEET